MPSRHDPADSLRHMIENAERVARHLPGMDRQSFEHNDWARDAVERCIERICEAAHRLGGHAEELMPSQPWGDIRGIGNRRGMPTTASTSTSFGKQPRRDCLNSQLRRSERLDG